VKIVGLRVDATKLFGADHQETRQEGGVCACVRVRVRVCVIFATVPIDDE
jgi:hypothetical protein